MPSTGPVLHPYTPLSWLSSPPPDPSSPLHAAIAPAVSLMEDLRFSRISSFRTHILPSGRAVNLRPNAPNGIIEASLDGLMTRIEKALTEGGAFAEPLYDVEVWVNGDIGVAWTPYDVWRKAGGGDGVIGEGSGGKNGEGGDGEEEELVLSHVGTDIIFLARVAVPGEAEKQWKISHIADNARLASSFTDPGSPPRYSGPALQDPVEEEAVLAVVQKIPEAFKSRRLELLHEITLPDTKWALYRGDTVRFMATEEVVERLRPIVEAHEVVEVLEEKPVVRVDHDVALVWAGFKAYIDGRLDHWGVDVMSLAKREGRWVITGLGDDHHVA